METINTALQRQGPWLYGVSFLRLAIVVGTVILQSLELSETYGRLIGTPIWILPSLLVPALFAISGFLLASNDCKYSAKDFARRRFTRGAPALVSTVLLAGLVLGPLSTVYTLNQYFSNSELWSYALNLIGIPRFYLPGVFLLNNIPSIVNGILWITPTALASYVFIIFLPQRARYRSRITGVVIGILISGGIIAQVQGDALFGPALTLQLAVSGKPLVSMICFLLGILAYELRDLIPLNTIIAFLNVIILVLVAIIGDRSWIDWTGFNVLIGFPLSYVTVFLMIYYQPFPTASIILRKYCSGILLLSFPVQQFWVAVGPRQQGFIENLMLSFPLTCLLAVLFWYTLDARFAARSPAENTARTVEATAIADVSIVLQGWQKRLSPVYFANKFTQLFPFFFLSFILLSLFIAAMAMLIFALQ